MDEVWNDQSLLAPANGNGNVNGNVSHHQGTGSNGLIQRPSSLVLAAESRDQDSQRRHSHNTHGGGDQRVSSFSVQAVDGKGAGNNSQPLDEETLQSDLSEEGRVQHSSMVMVYGFRRYRFLVFRFCS